MELIERYLFEVGQHLPPNQRADILSELRSSLEDSIEARGGEGSMEADIIATLKEMGPPRQVAASYNPQGQYLIGPELFPQFKFVASVAIAAVIGAQLLVVLISLITDPESVAILDTFWGLLGSIPMTLGSIVVVFALLQRYGMAGELADLDPAADSEPFDPTKLPPVADAEPVKKGEGIFELLVSTMVLVWLARYAYGSGFSAGDRIDFLNNPVLDAYFPWLALSMVIGILIDGRVLWQGRLERSTRVLKVLADGFGLGVLVLLVQGHSAWLAERGITGLIPIYTQSLDVLAQDGQLAGMLFFHMAFLIALIVTATELGIQIYRLARSAANPSPSRRNGFAGIS